MNDKSPTGLCQQLPQVALDFMNTVHCEELLITQRLYEALKVEQGDEQIDTLLQAWVEHTVAHFAREERLMLAHGFPPYPVHQGEHELALETLRKVQSDWLSGRNRAELEQYIKYDWSRWLFNHISTMDMVTANFLSQFDIQIDLENE